MVIDLPFYIPVVFWIAVLYTVYALYKASNKSVFVLCIASGWILLQCAIAVTGFYTDSQSLPPRFLLLPLPPVIAIILLFVTAKGRKLVSDMSLRWLTLIHVVRIP